MSSVEAGVLPEAHGEIALAHTIAADSTLARAAAWPAAVTGAEAATAIVTAACVVVAVQQFGPALPPLVAITLVVAQYVAIAAGAIVVLATAAARVAGPATTSVAATLRPRCHDVGPALRAWLAALGATAVAVHLLESLGVPIGASNSLDGRGFAAPGHPLLTWAAVALLVVVFAVVVPVVEELLFRGVLLPALRNRLTLAPAIAVHALVFAVFHVDPRLGLANIGLVVALLPSGIAFGVLTARSGRLGPAVLAHAMHNGLALAVVLVG